MREYEEAIKYYEESEGTEKVGYGLKFHQHARFVSAWRLITTFEDPSQPLSLLDFGCGTGDFLKFLVSEKGLSVDDYVGVDIFEDYISEARRREEEKIFAGAESAEFRVGDMSVLDDGSEFDWGVAIGSLEAQWTGERSEDRKIFEENVEELIKRTKQGGIITITNTYIEERNEEDFLVDPSHFFRFLRKRVGRVVLDDSFSPYCSTFAFYHGKDMTRRHWESE